MKTRDSLDLRTIAPVLPGRAAGGPGRSSSVRLFKVAFVLVLAGAMAWVEWFARYA